jgi:uncharacterized repeat protein (TIGR02543 family)
MKKILLAFFSFMMTIFLIVFMSFNPNVSYIDMMIQVNSIEEAHQLEGFYNIQLSEYSNFGIALYQVKEHDKDDLIKAGFSSNDILETSGKWDPTTTDPYASDQYALSLMHITEAWTLEEGSSDVTVAIIDTGIDTDHEEFAGRILQTSYNARTKTTSETNLSHVEDDNGHGTMVAGIIAANKNNGLGVAGIISNSKILVIKANNSDDPLTVDDESDQFLESSIAEAIHYARTQEVDIINLSLGTKSINSVTQAAVQQAIAAGIIIVGASGNDGDTSKFYPASYPGVISVGSVDETITVSDFSNYNDAVDISAPGQDIVSTSLNNGYVIGSGTSFAAPQVAGVIALMKSHFPTMSSENIIDQLLSTTVDRGDLGYDYLYGFGVVHAAQALSVDYVTITFETNGGTPIDPIQTVSGYSFDVIEPTKEGHIFLGWYSDALFTQPFEVGLDLASTNMTLYAKYEPSRISISLVSDQVLWQTIEVYYGEVINLPIPPEMTGYDFVGWYYDINFTTPYVDEVVLEPFTLYARFDKEVYQVSYYINGLLDHIDEYPYLNIPETPIPESELTFIGWYYDETFINSYTEVPITSSFSLYARFHDGQYTVTFYDYDLLSVLSTTKVYYGFSATAPDNPTKPNSPSFSFEFMGWSEVFDYITEDMSVYPVYEKTYLPMSIYLLPGIDTVSNFDLWEDASIYEEDLQLEIGTTIEEVDDVTYKISYRIMDGENIIDTRYRMVTVIPKVEITIELNPDISTIEVGQTYHDGGATSNVGTVEVTNHVDTSTPGIYEVIYEVQYEDQLISKVRYVHVLNQTSYHPVIIHYYRKEEGWVL